MARISVLRTATAKASSPLWMTSLRMRSTAAITSPLKEDAVKPFEEMPGPKPWPIIGNVWRFLPGIGEYSVKDVYGMQQKLQKKYGDIVRLSGIPGQPAMVFTFNPSDTETLFRIDGQWPERPGNEIFTYYYTKHKRDVTGGRVPLLAGQGEEWQTLRSAVQQPIMQTRTARMYISSVEAVTDEFMNRIRAMRDSKNEMPKDFHNELYKWALESIGLIALDTRLGCLTPNLDPSSEPQRLIDAIQDFFEVFITVKFGLPLWKYYRTKTWKKFEKSMDTSTSICFKYINRAVELLKNRSVDNEEEHTLLQRILIRDPDPTTAALVALDLLFAGIDTTSHSSANFLYLLAKNPDKQQKLYEEINRILPTTDTPVTDERMNEMKYLRACLKETLRIAAVVGVNVRILQSDGVFSGYKVPKGSMVSSAGSFIGTDSRIFPMADKFLPERWLRGEERSGCPVSKEEMNKVNPFASIPFGHGPRMCLGRRFAEMEIQRFVLKKMSSVQHFQCTSCNISFTQKTNFYRHMRACIHKGNSTTYKCKACQTTFSRKDNLTRHLKTHTKNEGFQGQDILQTGGSRKRPIQESPNILLKKECNTQSQLDSSLAESSANSLKRMTESETLPNQMETVPLTSRVNPECNTQDAILEAFKIEVPAGFRILHKVIRHYRRFNSMGAELEVLFPSVSPGHDVLETILGSLEKLVKAIVRNCKATDYIGMEIGSHNRPDFTLAIPMRRADQLTPGVVIDMIEDEGQSRRDIILGDGIYLKIHYIRIPQWM